MKKIALVLSASLLVGQGPLASIGPISSPLFRGGPALDQIIEESIQRDELPGAVALVGHAGRVLYLKSYGRRAVVPAEEPMTLDTIFDVASLTKVVATTSSIMKLVEMGRLRLNDRVTLYLPEFQGGTSDITVKQLLTHYSGMRPDVDLEPVWSGYETGVQKAVVDLPTAPPNARFTYSDINFILLGEIVRRVGGKPLPEFAKEHIFDPLGMGDTMFQPPPEILSRVAPTEIVPESPDPLRGIVHDPTTRYMGGVAGHAGLFSTATDLAKFAEMMLGMGERNGVRVFSPLTVRMFTSPHSPPDQAPVRGLGWDIDSPFSGNRGDLFPTGSYGHTGFTGASLWIDPSTDSYVVLLANAVHPRLRPNITPLRSRVASVAAAGLPLTSAPPPAPPAPRVISSRPQPRNAEVLTGIDVLAEDNFSLLSGKRVGLITNHTGLTKDGRRNIDAMAAAGVDLQALYSPEHGIAGKEDHENVGNTRDTATGIRVWSLYSGGNRRPSDEMLRDIDVLVFDIQDVGARFYTYVCTMKNTLEEAARKNIPFLVLDRPNPINGVQIEGPMLDADLQSFIGCVTMPLRHGMTMGEMAQMINADLIPKASLTVVKMRNWQREDWFDSTGLIWVDPSPNMRSLNAALLYPGIGMLEAAKVYSVGRGTDAPFEQIGADWIRGRELANYLNGRGVRGIRVYPTILRPAASNFAGKTIEGVRFVITDRTAFHSVRFGVELAVGLEKLFPGKMTWQANEKLVGSRWALEAMSKGQSPTGISSRMDVEVEQFRRKRAEFLLY